MITSIKFGNFIAEPKPPAPIGNPIGYGSANATTTVPVYNLKVNVNG